jgi:hypothetical protein
VAAGAVGGEHGLGRHAAFSPRVAPLVEGEQAADEGDDQREPSDGELDAQPAVGPRLPGDTLGCFALLLVPGFLAGVEERLLQLREIARTAAGDLEGDVEASAPVQRAGISAEPVPAGGRLAQVGEHDDRLSVVLDPAAQARPLPEQRLVGELDGGHPPTGDGGRG